MNNLKIISLLVLLNLASFAFAGSATENNITVIANIVQNSDGTGPVGDTELQTTITAETFASADTTIEVTRPASYSLKANADDTTPSTAQPVNFSMLFAETPELSNKKTTNFVGDTELGVNIAASLLQGTGTVGDTELQTTIAGEIGSGTSDTEKQVTVVANIFQNKNGVGPVGDTELQVTVSGQTSFGTTSASSQGVTFGGYIFQGNADNKPVGDTELQTTITGNIGFGTGDTENGVSVTGLIFQSSSGGDTEPRDTTDFQRTYSWDFDGDGVFDFQSDSSGNAVYAFSKPGNYLATARVIASDGTEVYDTILLNVSGPTIIKSCSINSETFNIELGQNAGPVSATYSSFFSTPTIESVVCASAPSNASLIGPKSCAGGSCSFSCGPYDAEKTEYIAALHLLDTGETVNCSGFAEVVAGSAPSNESPVAEAGGPYTIVSPGNTVNLDGSGSTDTEDCTGGGNVPPCNLTYSWAITVNDATCNLANPNTMTPTATCSGTVGTSSAVELTVTDSGGLTSPTATSTITVTAPPSPGKFRITSFTLEPNSVVQDETKTVQPIVKVINLKPGSANAKVQIEVIDAQGNSKLLPSLTSDLTPVSSASPTPTEFKDKLSFIVGTDWAQGIYAVKATVLDELGITVHDSKIAYLSVGELKTAVPETNIALLPLIAIVVLAIAFFRNKKN